MPPRENELPEGTDHIINGAMETNGGSGAAGGDAPIGGGLAGGGLAGGGFAAPETGSDTGGSSGGGTSGGTGGDGGFIAGRGDGTGGTAAGDSGNVVEQLRSQAFALRDQAGGKVREYADTGKTKATDALEELSRVFADTADTIDERLGGDYGEYARKAADTVSGFADTLRSKDVDELYGNVRDAVRKSPGVAIGVAAVVGFALARVVKAGFDETGTTGRSTNGTSSGSTGGGGESAGGA